MRNIQLKLRDQILMASAFVLFLISWRLIGNFLDAASAVGDVTELKNPYVASLKPAFVITIGYCIIYSILYRVISFVKDKTKHIN